MKPIVFFALAMALMAPATAQLYKWVDKDGKVFYSDTPPPGQETKSIAVPTAPAAAQKSALQKDKELDKARKGASEAEKKTADAAANAAKNEEACARAREAEANLAAGGRIRRLNDKGERVFLDENQMAAELEKARRAVSELCKKS